MALTKVTNSLISGATINPDDLGADPTGVDDSSTAIQDAFDTGLTVVFSNGANYKIQTGLTIPNGQVIDGNGATLTPVGTFNAITLSSSEFTLKNLNINASALTGTVIDAPVEIGGGTFWIEHVNITGGTTGLNLVNQYSAYITNCRFAYCANYCLYLTSTVGHGGINSLWFSDCYFVNSGSSGLPVVYIKATAGLYFNNCTWQGNNPATTGMQVESVNGLYVTNSYVEEYNTTRWLWFYNATTANVIQFIAIKDNYVMMDGIPVVFGANSKTNVQITGNTFQTTVSSSGPAVQGMTTGFIPAVYSNMGSRQDIDDSFVPTISFGGGSTGITYFAQEGKIRNDGLYLYGGIHITLSSKGSSTGNITFNIPSAMLIGVTNQNTDSQITTGVFFNLSGVVAINNGFMDNSSIRLYNTGATDVVALTDANFTNTSEIRLSFKSRFVDISQ